MRNVYSDLIECVNCGVQQRLKPQERIKTLRSCPECCCKNWCYLDDIYGVTKASPSLIKEIL